MKFGVLMKRSTYLLVSLFALAAAHANTADESESSPENAVALNEEVAALQRRTKGLNVVSGASGRVSTLEQQISEVYTDTVRDTFGAKAASARPQLDSYGVYVSGDAIYWKAFEGGTDYVSVTDSGYYPVKGHSERIDFHWRWGFKAELGYRTPHDGWDLAAHYTWFYDKARINTEAPANGALIPLLPDYYTSEAKTAHASWNLHFDDLDLSIQKSYFLSHSFALTPFGALRTAWINQHLHANYYAPRTSEINADQYGRNNFWGIGPKIGLSSRWFAGPHWNFFGRFAGSLLYAEFHVRGQTIGSDGSIFNLKGDLHRIVPTVQGALGFGWEMNFLSNRYHVAMNVAYEAQYWWRQNQLFDLVNSATPIVKRYGEDLGLHGLTINALFDF